MFLTALLFHCFYQFFQEEFHIGCQVRAFGLQGAADQENGVGAVDLYHPLEELPAHAARGNGEVGLQVGHFCFCAFADFLARILGEGEPTAEAGENDRVCTG